MSRISAYPLSRRTLMAVAGATAIEPLLPMFMCEAAPLAYELKPQVIGEGAWIVAGVPEPITLKNGGAIANITILDSKDGAIIVDTGPSRRFGEQLARLARELTGKEIARVYITHFHPDHAFGNQGFDAHSISAPRGVIDGLKEAGAAFSDAMYYIAQDWMRGTEVVLPQTIAVTGIEEIGGRKLHLFEYAGHTPSDLAILDENSGLLIAGDLVFLDRAPTTPHADIGKWRETLDKLRDLKASAIVPGHGPVEQGWRGIEQTRVWLSAIEEIITRSFESGLDMTEAMKQPLPDAISNIPLARYEFERSVMHIYPKLENALPAVGKKVL